MKISWQMWHFLGLPQITPQFFFHFCDIFRLPRANLGRRDHRQQNDAHVRNKRNLIVIKKRETSCKSSANVLENFDMTNEM